MRNSKKQNPDLILQYEGESVSDDLYRDQNNRHYAVSGNAELGLTISIASSIWGEPIAAVKEGLVIQIGERTYITAESGALEETPESIAANPKATTEDEKRQYRLLGRMQSDCEYFLGYGNRSPKHLWGGSAEAIVAEMKSLWKSFPAGDKPEWLTWEQIIGYEKNMCLERKLVESDSRYDYYFYTPTSSKMPEVLVIRDLSGDGPYRSVTNGMTQVIKDIEDAESRSLIGTPIIYVDSCGICDGIARGESAVNPYHLGQPGEIIRDELKARIEVLNYPDKWRDVEFCENLQGRDDGEALKRNGWSI